MTKHFIPMNKLNFRRVLGLLTLLFVAGSLTVGCYDDSELRASIDNLKSQLEQLKTLVGTLQNDDSVTGVTQNPDGSYTITFKKSGSVTISNGKDGKDGNDGNDGNDGKDGSIIDVTKDDANHTYVFTFSDGSTLVLPQYSELRVLTFEDADYRGPIKTATYWSSKVDDPQYGGPQLYGDQQYYWEDLYNTFLCGTVEAYDPKTWSGGFSGGGMAISHYGCKTIEGADYTRQLEVLSPWEEGMWWVGGCGYNGSDNFVVAFDPFASIFGGTQNANVYMYDGVPRLIESVYVNNTCYVLNSLINGDAYTPAMADNGFLKVTALGYYKDELVSSLDFYLAKTRYNFVSSWTKWDLSGLGEVTGVVFLLSGSKDLTGDYGLNTPAYVAFDNFAVRVYPE